MLWMVTHEGVACSQEAMLEKDNLLVRCIRGSVISMLDAPHRENVTILRGHIVRLDWEGIFGDELFRGEFSIIWDLLETLVKQQVIVLTIGLGHEYSQED